MPKPILELKYQECRFPVGGGLFCADKTHVGSYCAHHHTITHDPQSAAKNRRMDRGLRFIIKKGL